METLDGTLKGLMIGTDHWKDQDVNKRKVEYCVLQRNQSQREENQVVTFICCIPWVGEYISGLRKLSLLVSSGQ